MKLQELMMLYDHMGFRIDDPARWACGHRYTDALDDSQLADQLHKEAVETVARWRAENGL